MSSRIQFRIAEVHEIIELRARELRAGKPVESARFSEDLLSTTLHFGGFVNHTNVCCLTLLEQPDREFPAWQLRGMATTQSWQRKGAGRSLLQFAELYLKNRYPKVKIWCNARITAVPFYILMGYKIISEPFLINDIGHHQKMEKILL